LWSGLAGREGWTGEAQGIFGLVKSLWNPNDSTVGGACCQTSVNICRMTATSDPDKNLGFVWWWRQCEL
jgi:hypothetical protein